MFQRSLICTLYNFEVIEGLFGSKTREKVHVLCADREAGYKNAFSNFAKFEMNIQVKWKRPGNKEKYLLICNITSRIPEDVRDAFQRLNLKGKWLDNIMIIAMHYSEAGKHDNIYDFIGTQDDPLYSLQLKNMFYSGNRITRCQENENAKKDIKKFLGLP